MGAGPEVMFIDQGAQNHLRQLGEPDGCDVIDEVSLALDHQAIRAEHIPQLDRAAPPGWAGQPETQLIDGKAQVLDFVVVETEPTSESGGGDSGQAKELRKGGDHQSHFVAWSHDLPTVAACPESG